MHKVAAYLDKIASKLENMGRLKEAHDIDVVSNTLEAFAPNPLAPVPVQESADGFVNRLMDKYNLSENALSYLDKLVSSAFVTDADRGLFEQFVDALVKDDQLGFDDVAQAIHAVLGHPDWLQRWDPSPQLVQIGEKFRQTVSHRAPSMVRK